MKKSVVVIAMTGLWGFCLGDEPGLVKEAKAKEAFEQAQNGGDTPAGGASEVKKIAPIPTLQQTKKSACKPCKPVQVDPALTRQCMPKTLDTTELDAQGNWLVKRAFWEQAERTHERIMKLNNELYKSQAQFIKVRNDSDNLTDTAFNELGFEQGKATEVVAQLIDSVKAQRTNKGNADEAGRAMLQQLKEQQQSLEQITVRLKALKDLDDVLDKSVTAMTQQINECREYEKKSWDHFKTIGKELNDKKARDMFYEMDGYLRNVEQKRDYVTKTLWSYVNDAVTQVQSLVSELKESIDRLKTKGLDLGKEIDQRKKAAELSSDEKAKAELEKARKEAEDCKRQLNKGWWQQTKDVTNRAVSRVGSWVHEGVSWVKGLFGYK